MNSREAWQTRISLLLHRCQRLRLSLERLICRLPGLRGRVRVMATACWDFPIYSQTFVYQELTQLAQAGFRLRFVYSHLNPRRNLPSQFSAVWRARRRMTLHPAVCASEYERFCARMPERVESLVHLVSAASDLRPQEVREHYHFRQAFAFAGLVDAYRPDYLHSYFFYEGTFFAFCAAYLLDIPRGVSCYADHMLDDYALKVVGLHVRQCAVVVATSARIKRELIAIAPDADPERIVVKPNGINTDRFPIVRSPEPAPGEPYRVVCVSRIEPKKGLLYLLEATRLLLDRGVRIEVHLVGGADNSPASIEYATRVRERHAELSLNGIVHFEGRRSEAEIRGFLGRSHLYVAPFVETETGDKDGIPTSLLEGMSAGLPVVATDAGSITEVITNGEDGLLVAQRDSDALAAAIAELLDNPQQRITLGGSAAARIRDRFDVRRCERVLHECIRDVVRDRR